ncbi:MAG: GntR family transcriptional regulator [Phycisphaeraceae bacterium]|nr:GntR family transcriptional regulator [Phycisphaeraceae bacterium]
MIEPVSLPYAVTDQLLAAIFHGKIVGGDRLVETTLAKQFKVSRGPVREALHSLAGLGLVDIRPNRGALVRPFGPEQLQQIYVVRSLLEMGAVRLACGKPATTKWQGLHQTIGTLLEQNTDSPGWSKREIESDERFHALIAAECGNPRLRDEINRYYTLVRAIRKALGHQKQMQVEAAQEHLAILDALLQGDADLAADIVEQHIQRSAKAAMASMFPTNPLPIKANTL